MKLVWDVTSSCNLNCLHCGADNKNIPSSLSNDNIDNIINYISEFINEVDLLGGEPLADKNTYKIIEKLSEKRIKINIITNGQFSDDVVEKIMKYNINTILISIDGLEDDHDFVRGKGAFVKAMNFIEQMKKYIDKYNYNTLIGINYVINKRNSQYIVEFIKYFSDKKVDIIKINPLSLMGNAAENKELLYIDDVDLLDTYEKIAEIIDKHNLNNVIVETGYPIVSEYLNKKYDRKFSTIGNRCNALIESLYCSVDGILSPCRQYQEESVNIKNKRNIGFEEDYSSFNMFLSKLSSVKNDYCSEECKFVHECFICPLKNATETPNLCKVCLRKMNENIEKDYNRKFILKKPYNIVNKNNVFDVYYPLLSTVTTYTIEGILILKSIDSPKSIEEISKITSIPQEAVYEFLIHEKKDGKVLELMSDEE